jgi:hypothetical protein
MLRRHITSQWNRQAAHLIRIKCSGRASGSSHLLMSRAPRGSIGAPPEWGAEAYTVWSGHVSAPDHRLALIKA